MKFLLITITCLSLFTSNDKITNLYPRPANTEERLFFIQRNMNMNTIVYDANFDENGNLNEENPIRVYWIRFEEEGQEMELRYLEKTLAYGIEYSKSNTDENQYKIKIVADKSRELTLKQVAPYKALIYLNINSKVSLLDYMYIDADNSGFWPDLKFIELHGKDSSTGKKTYEKVLY